MQIAIRGDPGTSVAYFFFREDYASRRSLGHMLRSCAIQLAAYNLPYRQSALATLQRLTDFDSSDHRQLWDHLFRQQFNKRLSRKLILVLDGIDEAEESSRNDLKEIIAELSSAEGPQISMMFSSENGSIIEPDAKLDVEHISMTKGTIKNDLRTVAVSRLKTLSRLRKLTTRTKKRIAKDLCRRAESRKSCCAETPNLF